MPTQVQYEALRARHRDWNLRPWQQLSKADRELTLFELAKDRARRAGTQREMFFPTEPRDFWPGKAAKRCPVCGEIPRLHKRARLPYAAEAIKTVWFIACRCVQFPDSPSAEEALRAWNLAQSLATPA